MNASRTTGEDGKDDIHKLRGVPEESERQIERIADFTESRGLAGNFILLPAENLSDALVRRPQQRTVVSRGQVIACDGRFLEPRQG